MGPSLSPSGLSSFEPSPAPSNFLTPIPSRESNVAYLKPTSQSGTSSGGHSFKAVDGILSGLFSDGSVTHTSSVLGAWWRVDLEESFNIWQIIIYNRSDPCCAFRLDSFSVRIFSDDVELWSYQNP